MEFFVENWMWVLVVGIIILMTLIGYIAEKTDFGRKDVPKKVKKEKKKKQEKVEEIKEPIEVLEEENKPEVQMSLATDSILEPTTEAIEDVPEELKAPFGDVTFEEPNENVSDDVVTEPVVEEVVSEEPTEELKMEDIDNPDIELPDLDAIMSDVEDDDDDVWKF